MISQDELHALSVRYQDDDLLSLEDEWSYANGRFTHSDGTFVEVAGISGTRWVATSRMGDLCGAGGRLRYFGSPTAAMAALEESK